MTRVLVTGGNGFIGRQCLTQLIEKGYEVHAITTRIEKKQFDRIHWHQADLHNRRQTSNIFREIKPTHLLHLAWYTKHGLFWNSFENINWINTTIELLKEFSENGGRRIVSAGTCAEYEWNNEICSESTQIKLPATIYGRSKFTTQILLEQIANEYGITNAWGRIFMVYGPGEKPGRLVPSIIDSMLKDQPFLCTNGEQIRDYLYVNEVATVFVKLIETEINGIFNIASGEPIKIRTIVEEIANQLNKRHLIKFDALNNSNKEIDRIVADTNKIKNQLMFTQRVKIKEGIFKTIQETINLKKIKD